MIFSNIEFEENYIKMIIYCDFRFFIKIFIEKFNYKILDLIFV